MKFRIAAAALATFAATPGGAQPQAAPAGAAEALGQCLVMRSTGADRIAVARWLMGAIASTPGASGVVTVNTAEKAVADKAMAALFTRLITVDCAAESRVLFKANATDGFRVAGEALGRVAMEELFSSRAAKAGLEAYTRYLDRNAFKGVLP